MITLSKDQVIKLHDKVVAATGGLQGVRDEALLESALMSPMQTHDGMELYPSIPAKIARITYNLVNNHPFIDGNKRVGTFTMLLLLELNNFKIIFSDDELIHIGMSLASGKMSYEELLDFIFEKILLQARPGGRLNEEMGTYGGRRLTNETCYEI